jgi:hypothetical protein
VTSADEGEFFLVDGQIRLARLVLSVRLVRLQTDCFRLRNEQTTD